MCLLSSDAAPPERTRLDYTMMSIHKHKPQEVPKAGRGPLFVHCKGGYRGHLALRILVENGHTVRVEVDCDAVMRVVRRSVRFSRGLNLTHRIYVKYRTCSMSRAASAPFWRRAASTSRPPSKHFGFFRATG